LRNPRRLGITRQNRRTVAGTQWWRPTNGSTVRRFNYAVPRLEKIEGRGATQTLSRKDQFLCVDLLARGFGSCAMRGNLGNWTEPPGSQEGGGPLSDDPAALLHGAPVSPAVVPSLKRYDHSPGTHMAHSDRSWSRTVDAR